MQHDDFPREQGLWPKAGLPYRKRRVKTPKVLHIVLARQNTSVLPSVASREPDFRASCSICQHALGRRIDDEAVRAAVIVIWEAADRICGKRLKAALPHLVESMERHGHLAFNP